MFLLTQNPFQYVIPAVESPLASARRRRRRGRRASARSCKYGARKDGKCRKRPRRGRR
jgi:hypothetical protein